MFQGKLDTTGFDAPLGLVVSQFSGPWGSDCDYGSAVVVQPDGKIVVAGRTQTGAILFGTPWNALVARYLPNGQRDKAFGDHGVTITQWEAGDRASAVALQNNGSIVIAGSTNRGPSPQGFLVARFLANGKLDLSFGDHGSTITSFGPNSSAYARGVAVQADGRIVAAGAAYIGKTWWFVLARYLPDGALDQSFGNGGLVATHFTNSVSAEANAIAISRQTGKLIVAGVAQFGPGHSRFALACYLPHDGSLDASFGVAGEATIAIGTSSAARAVAISHSGQLVVAGSGSPRDPHEYGFVVARCEANGTIDPSFGQGGHVYAPFQGYGAIANGVVVLGRDEIVAVGEVFLSTYPLNFQQGIAAFDSNGTPIPMVDGVTTIQAYSTALGVAHYDNEIVTVGWTDDGSQVYDGVTVARYV
jgi:uncharacterized delta-60 repeat protein